ncbi:19826_t:CDS:2, partial [Gigaspora margarita]
HVQTTINSQFVDTENYPGTVIDTQDNVSEVMSFSNIVKFMTKVLYRHEITQKLLVFRTFEEFRTCMEAEDRHLNAFFNELCNLALYLDSTGMGNSTINALAELGITSTSQTVWRKKKEISDNHMDTVNNYLEKYHETSMILN